jgi:hypothetical protein
MGTSTHIPYTDAILIPMFAALLCVVVRFAQLEKSSNKSGLWEILAVGPDLMVAAVAAIPGLIAARNLGLHEAVATHSAGVGSTSPAVISVMVLLMACFLFGGANYDRVWGKDARAKTGVREPLVRGVLPCALLGVATLGLALFVGTS